MKAAQLRQSILQAAVQGKLVPQDLRDEPGSELLARIKTEKAQLIKEGKIKKEKPLPPIAEGEIPYDLPDGWAWCRFANIATIASFLVQPTGYSNHFHIAPDNIEKYTGRLLAIRTVAEDEVKSNNHIFAKGQIIYSKIRPALRKAVIAPFDGLCSADMYPLDSYIEKGYLLYFLLSSLFTFQVLQNETRVKMPKTNQEELKRVIVPLPPLAEQQRIVAKVDELMALCDELEAAEKELDKLEADFAEYLPKTILQAAVQGKLVPQDIRNEPASELLARIRAEKERLVREGKIKKEKPLPPITEDDVPYDLPDGWVWCRLGEIAQFKIGKTPARADEIFWNNGTYPWVSIADMKSGEHLTATKEKISQVAFDTVFKGNIVPKGSLLFSFKLSIGKVVILDIDAFTNEAICSIVPFACDEIIEFLFRVFPALDLLSGANDAIKGKTLNSTSISQLLIPLPPLAEQQRIVAKVDGLMALCDELKAARDIPLEPVPSNIISFPVREDEAEEIRIAARGDIQGLSDEALRDINKLFGDDTDA